MVRISRQLNATSAPKYQRNIITGTANAELVSRMFPHAGIEFGNRMIANVKVISQERIIHCRWALKLRVMAVLHAMIAVAPHAKP